MISDFEKYIYNLHLRTSRQQNNKPFNLRKDFNDLDDKSIAHLKKLSNFFNKHKEIEPSAFFLASYSIHKDEKFFELSHFISLKAIKAYTIFCSNVNNLDPDSDDQLTFTKKSLVFIYNFCKNNKIDITSYLSHKTNDIYSFLLHLKNRDINIYSLLGFEDLNAFFTKSDLNILSFMFEDKFLDKVNTKKIKFLNSSKCKVLVVTGLDRFKKRLKNELNML
jgi:hypothetical protein